MKRLRDYVHNNAHTALSLPAIMCFMQFSYELYDVFKSGSFDANALSQLVSSANGFETVVLCVIMVALKDKNR